MIPIRALGSHSLFLALSVAVLGAGQLLTEYGPPASKPLDVPAALPADTLLHLEIVGAPLGNHGRALAVARLCQEPEMKAFLAPLEGMIEKGLERAEGALKESVGLGVDDLTTLLEGRHTISLMGMVAQRDGSKEISAPDIIATIDLRGAPARFRQALGRLEGLLEPLADTAFRDVDFPEFQARGLPFADDLDRVGAFYTILGDTLVIGTSKTTFGECVECLSGRFKRASSLADREDFRRVRDHIHRPTSVVTAWLDVADLLAMGLKSAPQELRDAFGLWGLDTLGAMGYGLELDGDGVRERSYVRVGEQQGWMAGRINQTTPLRTPGMVPRETGFFFADMLDFAEAFEGITGFLEQAVPRQAESVRRFCAKVERALGMDMEEMLSVLGPEYAFYMAWPGQSIVPDFGLLVQVRESARMRSMLDTAKEAVGDRVVMRELPYQGKTINYLDYETHAPTGADFARHTLRPSFVDLDGFLLVTLWPQAAKKLIRSLKHGPVLTSRPDYVYLTDKLKGVLDDGASSQNYMAFADLIGFVCENGAPILQSVVPAPREGIPVDVAALPTQEVLDRHLFGILSASAPSGERGLYSETYSPMGILPGYATAFAVVALAIFPVAARGGEDHMPPQLVSAADSQREQALADMEQLRLHIEDFQDWEGELPGSKDWPGFITKGSPNHPDSYNDNPDLTDPWGRPYAYRPKNGGFRIICWDSDGQPGGEGLAQDVIIGDG